MQLNDLNRSASGNTFVVFKKRYVHMMFNIAILLIITTENMQFILKLHLNSCLRAMDLWTEPIFVACDQCTDTL